MSFSTQIGRFSSKTKGRLHAIRRGVIIKLFTAVINDTPVLSGRARGNWRFSHTSPELEETARLDPSGSEAIKAVETGVGVSDGNVPVFLTNNLPYIEGLENGKSAKAPHGMVRKNIVRFNQLMRGEVKK